MVLLLIDAHASLTRKLTLPLHVMVANVSLKSKPDIANAMVQSHIKPYIRTGLESFWVANVSLKSKPDIANAMVQSHIKPYIRTGLESFWECV